MTFHFSLSRVVFAALCLTLSAAVQKTDKKRYHTNAKRDDTPGVVNVHIIAHTHDDVGWLKTPLGYFIGLNNTIQHASVRHILTSTVQALVANPDRKFIYVEQAFFQMWWNEQDDDVKATTRMLVEEGRLSFVNGGFCMHDEATTIAQDMVAQTQLGHRYISTQFGNEAIPGTTWSIDPFGHSGVQASLLSSQVSGFDSLFVSRADYSDIAARTKDQQLEYIWQASPSLGASATTFFSIMNLGQHLYFPFPGFQWDISCNDPEVQDDLLLDDYNVLDLVANTIATVNQMTPAYVGGDIYLTQGGDFFYEYAEEAFSNIDKWIHYVNLNTSIHNINMFYSTPQDYARVKLSYPIEWPMKVNDDGFPYADGPHSYWTGYYTSRPAFKGYVRELSSYFAAANQIQATSNSPQCDLDRDNNPLFAMGSAMGFAQHHDAVSGTEMQYVEKYYSLKLAEAKLEADAYLGTALPELFNMYNGGSGNLPANTTLVYSCDLANATICPALEAGTTASLFVYNSQSQGKTTSEGGLFPIRIPVPTTSTGVSSWSVYLGDSSGTSTPILAQTMPISEADEFLRTSYYNYTTPSNPSITCMLWLCFMAPVPAMGVSIFSLVPKASVELALPWTVASEIVTLGRSGNNMGNPLRSVKAGLRGSSSSGSRSDSNSNMNMHNQFGDDGETNSDQTISNALVTLTISGTTGLLSRFQTSQLDVPLTQTWFYYNASVGNEVDSQASGAYIFRPNSSTNFIINAGNAASVTLITGPIVNEAVQVIDSTWLSQRTTLWVNRTDFDVEFTVGGIPFLADGYGKEVVVRYGIDTLVTNATWQTDSNGRDMYTRRRNYRTWNTTIYEPVAGNYYPVNTAIQTADVTNGNTLWLVTDRSEGGSSLVDGSIEVMVHRRLQADDGRGVGEPLNETFGSASQGLVIRGMHRLGVAKGVAGTGVSVDPASVPRRTAVNDISLAMPTMFVGPMLPSGSVPSSTASSASILVQDLPANVQVMTLQSFDNATTIVIRLAHMYAINEDPVMSANATVDLGHLLKRTRYSECTETTLPGVKPLAGEAGVARQVMRRDGTEEEEEEEGKRRRGRRIMMSLPVTLSALQVRTFVCA